MTTKHITVQVSDLDIQTGERCAPNKCPVAKALYAALPHHDRDCYVRITEHWIDVFGPGYGQRKTTPTPRRVARFVRRFDRQQPVEPFRFRLEVNL